MFFDIWIVAFRGFSEIYLIQNTLTKVNFALKEITCHSIEDQNAALQEANYHNKFKVRLKSK